MMSKPSYTNTEKNNGGWVTTRNCANCRYYFDDWCYWHETPACKFATCDEFKRRIKDVQK